MSESLQCSCNCASGSSVSYFRSHDRDVLAAHPSSACRCPAHMTPLPCLIPCACQALVFGGAALYIFSRSAKFSLFKPAEEMVYIR